MLDLKINKFFFHIILEKPCYYYNIFSISRLSIGLCFALHVVGVFSFFSIKKKHFSPGIDYFENCNIFFYNNLLECLNLLNCNNIYILEPNKNNNSHSLFFPIGSAFILGSENKSVNTNITNIYQNLVNIPFFGNIRSYNLSQSVSLLSSFLLKNLFVTFLCLFA